ncbi:MAG: hypothetical protein KJ607_11790 [Bacteroidetes bacterium]|nr:hypothetical protein [Bacteroidota bacterium]
MMILIVVVSLSSLIVLIVAGIALKTYLTRKNQHIADPDCPNLDPELKALGFKCACSECSRAVRK